MKTGAIKVWLLAARPRTLPAAVVPVMLGSALAVRDDGFALVPAMLCLGFAFLIQIGTNYANDYYDYMSGADSPDRIGPVRAVAAGLVEPELMRRVMSGVFFSALLLGSVLILYGGWWLLFVGIASVLSGIAYTGGPYPLGYHGLGDLFVFLFFGIIAVMFTYYVQAGTFTLDSFFVSLAVGSLTTNVLVVNNLRDIETDRAAGKRTLAVRFGRKFSIIQYQVFFLTSLLIPVLLWRLGFEWIVLLPVLCWPWTLLLRRQLTNAREGREYNQVLADTARFLLLYGILFSIGIAVG